jgi:hypothetical protein
MATPTKLVTSNKTDATFLVLNSIGRAKSNGKRQNKVGWILYLLQDVKFTCRCHNDHMVLLSAGEGPAKFQLLPI